nr:hypothetical protein [Actinomadura madurae]
MTASPSTSSAVARWCRRQGTPRSVSAARTKAPDSPEPWVSRSRWAPSRRSRSRTAGSRTLSEYRSSRATPVS